MEAQELRRTFGEFATGVTVITCLREDGTPHGATVTAFMPLSLDPPLLQVALTRTAKACAYLRDAPFAVNVLAADQIDLAWHFAGRPSAEPPRWEDGPTGPLLCGAAAAISCRPWATYDGGDHEIFVGEIVASSARATDPLLFFRSAFHGIGENHSLPRWSGQEEDSLTGWFDADTSFTALPARPLTSTPGV